MKKFVFGLSALVVMTTAFTLAKQPKTPPPAAPTQKPMTVANPYTSTTQFYYNALKMWITKAAEQMPEKDYAFKPTTAPAADKQEIRTFARLVGHIADANYMFCGTGSGMKGPGAQIEDLKGTTTKAALQKALADSFAFCDKAWAATDDKNALTPASFPPPVDKELPATTRLGALVMNSSHLGEHYGNMVVYLRIKGLVPPSSQPPGK